MHTFSLTKINLARLSLQFNILLKKNNNNNAKKNERTAKT